MCRFRLREAGSGWGRNDTLRRFVIPAHDFSDGVLLIPRYRAIQYLGARTSGRQTEIPAEPRAAK
ncbi:hypothetical protein ALQ05_200230 [Pseudomonas amygdali pv. mori]|uniref:Uncharacterized protein n=1 Tax=Pseudomonas amygdali pv. mori TaxID=34065 RepID=A0A3M4L900_PSEA0|nr:hypothetical protein ALQ05_200230 [Pseudomonas amygdali pv. mori]